MLRKLGKHKQWEQEREKDRGREQERESAGENTRQRREGLTSSTLVSMRRESSGSDAALLDVGLGKSLRR